MIMSEGCVLSRANCVTPVAPKEKQVAQQILNAMHMIFDQASENCALFTVTESASVRAVFRPRVMVML